MSGFEVNRRGFVVGSLISGAFPLGGLAQAADLRGAGAKPRLHRLLVDHSIPESVRLGTYAEALADEVFAFDHDPTALWQRELRTIWPQGPRPIAGLTTPAVRMVFEQLGRDHGARIVFSAEHRTLASGMRHELSGCDDLLTCPDLRVGADWVADMARHLAAAPREAGAKATTSSYETGRTAGMADRSRRLVTWVLAPVQRRNDPRSFAMARL